MEGVQSNDSFHGYMQCHGILAIYKTWTSLPIEFSPMEQSWTAITL